MTTSASGSVPVPPQPLFSQLDTAAQTKAVAELRKFMEGSKFPNRREPLPTPIGWSALSKDLRRRLERAEKAGYAVPRAIRKDVHRPARPGQLIYVGPHGARQMPYTKGNSAAIAAGILAMVGSTGLVGYGAYHLGASILAAGVLAICYLAVCLPALVLAGEGYLPRWRHMLWDDDIRELHDAAARSDASTRENKLTTRENKLTTAAANLINQLTSSPAWNSSYLDTAHALFDPSAELTEIRSHAEQISELRTDIGKPTDGNSPEQLQAASAQRADLDYLDTIYESLLRRVAALWHYTTVVDDLSAKIQALQTIEKSMATAPRLEALAAQIGADDVAIDRYATLTANADALREQIVNITNILSAADGPR